MGGLKRPTGAFSGVFFFQKERIQHFYDCEGSRDTQFSFAFAFAFG
jgi:hypothetical protein